MCERQSRRCPVLNYNSIHCHTRSLLSAVAVAATRVPRSTSWRVVFNVNVGNAAYECAVAMCAVARRKWSHCASLAAKNESDLCLNEICLHNVQLRRTCNVNPSPDGRTGASQLKFNYATKDERKTAQTFENATAHLATMWLYIHIYIVYSALLDHIRLQSHINSNNNIPLATFVSLIVARVSSSYSTYRVPRGLNASARFCAKLISVMLGYYQ